MRALSPTVTDHNRSGLAWHTEEGTLRQKFEEFGRVEEAVSDPLNFSFFAATSLGASSHFVCCAPRVMFLTAIREGGC